MAAVTDTTIPPGRYWTIASGDADMDRTSRWIVAHADTIRVVNSEYDPGQPGPFTDPVGSQFFLFDVLEPTPREGLLMFAAPAGAQQQSDVYVPEKSPIEEAEDILHRAESGLETAGNVVFWGLLLYALYKIS